jgi:phosphatidylinositol alpha-mannosyltransferase
MTIGLLLDDTLDKEDGVQKAVLDIGRELSRRKHVVHYITSQSARTDLDNVHSVGKFLSMKFNGNSVRTPLPASRKRIQALFDEINFDVLHVQMPYSPFLAAKVLKMAPQGVKKFGTFHILPYNFTAKYGTHALGRVMQRSIQSLDHCFAVSAPAKRFMDSAFRVNGSVLPNPVDYTFFSGFSRQKQAKKQVVFVGRFEERKGVKQLVEAYSRMENHQDYDLIMCGKGPLHEEVQQFAKERNVSVQFPGFISDEEKAQYLANADIAVFPSVSGESFGIVLTEAMSAGARVTIGGNNPGYASVLEPWPETLFDPNDTDAFAQVLQAFLHDAKLTKKIGIEQHEAVKQYDISKVCDELEKSYQS